MKSTIYFFLFFFSAALFSCGEGSTSDQQAESAPEDDPKRITLLTSRHYPEDDSIFNRLNANQGYTVEVVERPADALVDSLAAYAAADVVVFPDLTYAPAVLGQNLLKYHGLPGLDSYYKSGLRDQDGFWTGLTRRYPVIAYEKGGPETGQLSSFQDLASQRWKGKLLLPPATDAALLTIVTSIYVQQGEDDARKWIKQVLGNGSGRTSPAEERLLALAVGPELLTISMLDDYAYLRQPETHQEYQQSESLAIVMPKDQDGETYYTLSFAAMPVQADPMQATALIEFLCSQYAQDKYASAAFELPANVMTLPAEPLLDYLGGVKDDDMSMEVMVQYLPVAQNLLKEEGWP